MGNPNIPPGPGRPKGLKNKSTLEKEARRAMFDKKISDKWEEIIDKLPPTYVADQFIGKAKEVIELQGLDFDFDKNEEESKLE